MSDPSAALALSSAAVLTRKLSALGLSDYQPSFLQHGFANWEALCDITEHDLEHIGLARGLRRKLQKEIQMNRRQSRGTKRSDSFEMDQHDSNDESPAKVPRRKYKRHPKPDPHAPERPLTAYVRFAKDRRRSYEGSNMTFSGLAKQIGVEWQELATPTKNQYLQDAGEDWTAYRKALNKYQSTREHAEYVAYLHDFARKNPGSNIKPPYADALSQDAEEERSAGGTSQSPQSQDYQHFAAAADGSRSAARLSSDSALAYDALSAEFLTDPSSFAHAPHMAGAQMSRDPRAMGSTSHLPMAPQLQSQMQPSFPPQLQSHMQPHMQQQQQQQQQLGGHAPAFRDPWQLDQPSLQINTQTGQPYMTSVPSPAGGSGNPRLREALVKSYNSRRDSPGSGVSAAVSMESEFSSGGDVFFSGMEPGFGNFDFSQLPGMDGAMDQGMFGMDSFKLEPSGEQHMFDDSYGNLASPDSQNFY